MIDAKEAKSVLHFLFTIQPLKPFQLLSDFEIMTKISKSYFID